jgi:hypothetical protein
MNKYENLKEQLATNGTGKMKCFRSSMTPIIESGAMITFVKQEESNNSNVDDQTQRRNSIWNMLDYE